MARRAANSRAKATDGSATVAGEIAPPPKPPAAGDGETLDQLRAERDRLRLALAAAEARVAALEKACGEAADRVAWVIDSLQNVAEDEHGR